MIPTRLNQQFNRGTVVGFDLRTGSVLVMANSAVSVPSYPDHLFESIQRLTLENYPRGYKWPTQLDFRSLISPSDSEWVPVMSGHFRQHLFRLNFVTTPRSSYYINYLVTSSTKVNSETGIIRYWIVGIKSSDDLYAQMDNYFINSGMLIPVLYINGENCDTYEI